MTDTLMPLLYGVQNTVRQHLATWQGCVNPTQGQGEII